MMKTARTFLTVAYNLSTGSFRETERLRAALSANAAEHNRMMREVATELLANEQEIERLRESLAATELLISTLTDEVRMVGAQRGVIAGAVRDEADAELTAEAEAHRMTGRALNGEKAALRMMTAERDALCAKCERLEDELNERTAEVSGLEKYAAQVVASTNVLMHEIAGKNDALKELNAKLDQVMLSVAVLAADVTAPPAHVADLHRVGKASAEASQ